MKPLESIEAIVQCVQFKSITVQSKMLQNLEQHESNDYNYQKNFGRRQINSQSNQKYWVRVQNMPNLK